MLYFKKKTTYRYINTLSNLIKTENKLCDRSLVIQFFLLYETKLNKFRAFSNSFNQFCCELIVKFVEDDVDGTLLSFSTILSNIF